MTRDEYLAALSIGYGWALSAAAQRVDELDALWRPIRRPTHEQVIAARTAEMEKWAMRQPWITWRGCYPGGPVDFETGRLRERIGAAA